MSRRLKSIILFGVLNFLATLMVIAFVVGSYIANADSIIFALNIGKLFSRLIGLLGSATLLLQSSQYIISIAIVAYIYRRVELRILRGVKSATAIAYLLLAPVYLALVSFAYIVFLEGGDQTIFGPEQADIVLFVFVLQSILSFIIGLRLIVQLRRNAYETESK